MHPTSDESIECVPGSLGSGEDRKDTESSEELERDESQGIVHEKGKKVIVLIFHCMHAQNVFR